jgi:hypothetical protein
MMTSAYFLQKTRFKEKKLKEIPMLLYELCDRCGHLDIEHNAVGFCTIPGCKCEGWIKEEDKTGFDPDFVGD